jgi:hypothetical protein
MTSQNPPDTHPRPSRQPRNGALETMRAGTWEIPARHCLMGGLAWDLSGRPWPLLTRPVDGADAKTTRLADAKKMSCRR